MSTPMKNIQSYDHDHPHIDDIYLRPFTVDDVDDFMVWATDDRVTQNVPWNTYTSKEDGLSFLKNFAIPHPYCRAICWKNRAIGSISVTPNDGDMSKCRAELGYVLASKYWGKGIMTRAVSMVVSEVFKRWPELERVEAVVLMENVASQRVLEKVGFKREGVLRKYMMVKGECVDVFMLSFLSSDLRFEHLSLSN